MSKLNYLVLGIILFIGVIARLPNLESLPTNDEIIYTVASAGYVNHYYEPEHGFYDTINSEHPPTAKWFFSMACWFTECDQKEISEFHPIDNYPLKNPTQEKSIILIGIMNAMRYVSLFFGIALILLVYWLVSKHSQELAMIAAALVAVSPLLSLYSGLVMLDEVFAFFFTATFYYYFFVYRKQESTKNLLVLSFLFLLCLGTKTFIPFYLIPIILITDFADKKKINFGLLAGLVASVAIFLTLVYPLPVFMNNFTFFNVGKNTGFNFQQPLSIFSIETNVLACLLVFSIVMALWKWNESRELKLALLALLIGVLCSFIGISGIVPRYSIYLVPLMILPIVFLFGNEKFVQANAMPFFLIMILMTAPFMVSPYFESYHNGFAEILNTNPTYEREASLGTLAYLQENNITRFVTNDYYNFPYYFNESKHFTEIYNKETCSFVKQETPYDYFVFRKDSWEHLFNSQCVINPSIGSQIVYKDEWFDVYQRVK